MMRHFKVLFFTVVLILSMSKTLAAESPVLTGAASTGKVIQYKPNAQTMTYAFIFDGPNEKNEVLLKQFQKEIIKSTAPEYKAGFPRELVFTGNWTEQSVKNITNKALNSNAIVVVSLGYLSTKYLNEMPNKNKFVLTIDQYGLRDIGEGFFNPIQQSASGIEIFHKLFEFKKAAILMNEGFYKTRNDWDKVVKTKLPGINAVVVPVNGNMDKILADIKGCDAVVFTPLFNVNVDKRKDLIQKINERKIPTFSTLGREDVDLGVLFGAGAYDLDRKVAEALSFNIHDALKGKVNKHAPVQFYEDEILYVNKDTAEQIGHTIHLRVLNTAEVISHKPPVVYNLSSVFGMLANQNLDIERKKLLVKAARRSSTAALLKYLPSFGVTLGYQQYNHDYGKSVALSVPEKTGLFTMGLEQVIYSPALVTNILIKKKAVEFTKAEQFMTEQNLGIETALLYVDTLILENIIKVQKEYVKESRENLAIARVREKKGDCGNEEALRWAAQLSINEQHLLDMEAELKNLKISINKLLFKEQTEEYELAELKSTDPAFYTSEIHVIDYVITEPALEQFTKMLVEEAYSVAPELEKLKAAIKMKDYEMSMYYQKFILPDAKLLLEYTSLMNRSFGADQTVLPFGALSGGRIPNTPIARPEATNLRFGVFAQWKPIEGGSKIAEIARIKAEREELYRYEDEIKTELESHIRETVNKALAAYFSIRKNYKAMSASQENYYRVKDLYLKNNAPIAQLIDAQRLYLDSKANAINSQYVFFKELLWVQRGICAVDWTKASPEAKAFIQRIKDNLEKKSDINYL